MAFIDYLKAVCSVLWRQKDVSYTNSESPQKCYPMICLDSYSLTRGRPKGDSHEMPKSLNLPFHKRPCFYEFSSKSFDTNLDFLGHIWFLSKVDIISNNDPRHIIWRAVQLSESILQFFITKSGLVIQFENQFLSFLRNKNPWFWIYK